MRDMDVRRESLTVAQREFADRVAIAVLAAEDGVVLPGRTEPTAVFFYGVACAMRANAEFAKFGRDGTHFLFAAWVLWLGWSGIDHGDAVENEWRVGRYACIRYGELVADRAAMEEVVL